MSVLIAGEFQNCVAFGASAPGQETCVRCASQFYLKDGTCHQSLTIRSNCFAYSGDGVCMACDPDYVLINNSCTAKIIDNCAVYKEDFSCLYCLTSYYKSGTTCSPRGSNAGISDCLYYSALNKCEVCKFSYDLSAARNSCTLVSVQNCFSLSSATQCKYCLADFYLSGSGTCAPVPAASRIDQCQIYAPDLSCLFCKPFTFFDNATRSCKEVPWGNLINGCYFYKTATSCEACEAYDGVSLVISPKPNGDNTCVAGGTLPDHCLAQVTGRNCLVCDQDFLHITSGSGQVRCQSAVNIANNCLSFDQTQFCKICENGFSLYEAPSGSGK